MNVCEGKSGNVMNERQQMESANLIDYFQTMIGSIAVVSSPW
jgi:hypothetical protein